MSAAVKHDSRNDVPQPHEVKISSKNQITIPVAMLAAAQVKAGDHLRIEVVGDGEIRLTRYHDPRLALLNEIIGSAPGISAAADLEELRNEWDR
jgi:bifunctional DNA-binding transcriptional regulator/antitoxin component of YhaV-PrlF toxin-antitoxin module